MKNTITISNDLLNRDLRDKILSLVGDYVDDYRIDFSGGYIYLDIKLRVKTLGDISAKYKLQIIDLIFNNQDHRLKVSYKEDVKSTGSLAQSMMMKVISLKDGTFLQTALGMTNPPGVNADEKSCSIDLEQLISINNDFFSKLDIHYLDSRDGTLQLSFDINL